MWPMVGTCRAQIFSRECMGVLPKLVQGCGVERAPLRERASAGRLLAPGTPGGLWPQTCSLHPSPN